MQYIYVFLTFCLCSCSLVSTLHHQDFSDELVMEHDEPGDISRGQSQPQPSQPQPSQPSHSKGKATFVRDKKQPFK